MAQIYILLNVLDVFEQSLTTVKTVSSNEPKDYD